MAVTTKFRIAEQALRIINGGDPSAASEATIQELIIAAGQIANTQIKAEYFQINGKVGEKIPNGSVLGHYEGIAVSEYNGLSTCLLPIKPIKLLRNMGVWAIRPSNDPTNEFIPLQLSQFNLIQSQPMINELLNQVGYEVRGMRVVFTKDISADISAVDMDLVVMDMNEYSDYDPLPLLPEQEWPIVQELVKMFGQLPTPDKVVDSSVKAQKNVPIQQQKQS